MARGGAVEVRVSARGVAFWRKGNGRPLTGIRVRVLTTGRHVEFFDWPSPGEVGVLTSEEARIGERSRAVPRWGRRCREQTLHVDGGEARWVQPPALRASRS
jgi:hypothetical protein